MSEETQQDRSDMKKHLAELRTLAEERGIDVSGEMRELERRIENSEPKPLTRFDRVQLARHQERPFTLDYIQMMCDDFVELHGDRNFRDDPAIVGGWATLDGKSVMVIGHQKGRDMKENLHRNFGSPHPEGYRKAGRLMLMAEKFGRPVITFVDTQGAYPGIGAEERGQAEAIARNLFVMAGLEVPIVSCIIGEGGSGGALGIAVADRVLMMENAIYSVISPEGCAAILWRSRDMAADAAEALKLTAPDLADSGIIDEVVPEPGGGAHFDPEGAAEALREAILRHLSELGGLDRTQLIEARRAKYYAMGAWEETGADG
ncbi:MAG: acetyl-CoA carboxylase carboxyltransferase subunit alpha [Candidatus Palauibacterales bacterium]|nr:acetyl-CoA carboxylase carboxyltransferase subunit alpha [Candidatus Palauibacterales bacterium]MDP2483927.1 acetyl-CoA carboxylase carboxyltransferase subunit alpha [Candidatus Palauibacterales bacterium]